MATINAGDIFATLKLKDELSGTLGKLASKFGPMAAALGGVAVAAGTAHKALMAQAEAEAGVNKLNIALANQGKFTQAASNELQGFASQLQRTTTFSTGAAVAAEAAFARFGLSVPQIKEATAAAADLAAGMGIELAEASNILARAAAGNTAGLSKLGIAISETIPKSQRLEAAIRGVNAQFGGQAEAATLTYAGALKQLENAIDDAWESAGKLLGTVGDFGSGGGPMSGAIDLVRRFADFLGKDVVIALSEVRARFAEFLASIFSMNARLADAIADAAAKVGASGLAQRMRDQAAAARLSEADMDKLAISLREAGEASAAASGKHAQVTNNLKPFKAASEEAANAAKELAKALEEAGVEVREMALSVESGGNVFAATTAHAGDFDKILVQLAHGGVAQVDAALAQLPEHLTGLNRAVVDAVGPANTLVDAMAAWHAQFDEINAKSPVKTLEEITIEAEKAAREAAKNAQEWANLAGAFDHLGESIGGSLGNLLKFGAAGAQIFSNLEAGRSMNNLQRTAAAATGLGSAIQGAARSGTAAGAALRGAMGGAAAGAVFGPWGAAIGGVVGAIGGLFGRARRLREETRKLRDEFIAQAGGMRELRLRAEEAGLSLDALMKARDPQAAQKAIDELKRGLQTFDEAWQKVNAAMERYGLTIEQMGPKFQQQELDKQALQLLEDYRLLTAAGAEWETVIAAMAPAMQTYIDTALASGATVPEAMRTQIERMIEMGLLLDENGVAFTSVEDAGITFAETMTDAIGRLIERINELVSAILGVQTQAGQGIDIPTNIRDLGGVISDVTGGELPPGFQSGSGGFQNFGAGTPVTLHGREAVVTEAQAAGAASSVEAAINRLGDRIVRAVRDGVMVGSGAM